jgi:hypothetical protein
VEYDAFPGLGYHCGHNLFSTASITGFVALAYIIGKLNLQAEEYSGIIGASLMVYDPWPSL